jgi:hypothetical protein
MKIIITEKMQWCLDRIGESSTWQAIGFIVSLFGSHFVGVDWGQGAALGGFVSALIKMLTKG